MKLSILGCLIFLFAGCASRLPAWNSISWQQVDGFADVTFGDPIWDGDSLRIPITKQRRPNNGNSLHVLVFDGRASGDLIEVIGHLRLPENAPSDYDLLIEVPDPPRESYWLVYKNPDGTFEQIREVQVPPKTNLINDQKNGVHANAD